MAQAEERQRALTSIDVGDPRLYQEDAWRPLFAVLRRDDPVHYCGASRFGPYWSVTRYDDISGSNSIMRTVRRVRNSAASSSPIIRGIRALPVRIVS